MNKFDKFKVKFFCGKSDTAHGMEVVGETSELISLLSTVMSRSESVREVVRTALAFTDFMDSMNNAEKEELENKVANGNVDFASTDSFKDFMGGSYIDKFDDILKYMGIRKPKKDDKDGKS